MDNVIKELLSIDNREEIETYCIDNELRHLGKGTGRSVYLLSSFRNYTSRDTGELVVKVAMNEAGRRQNEVEVTISNHGSDICANIYRHHHNYEWIIMDRVWEMTRDRFDEISGCTTDDRVIYFDYVYFTKYNADLEPTFKDIGIDLNTVKSRVTQRGGEEFISRMKSIPMNKEIEALMDIDRMEAGDLVRHSSWGYSDDNPDKPLLFDYGLSHKVFKDCYKVDAVPLTNKNNKKTFSIVVTPTC